MKLLINLNRLFFIIFSVIELGRHNITNVVLLLGSCLLTYIPELYTKLTKIHIPIEARFFYDVFIFCSQFLGTYLRAYDILHWWDVMLHLASGVMIGYVGLLLMLTVTRDVTIFQQKNALLVALFIFSVGATGAVVWEIIEFTGDTLFGTNAQLGSLQDTMEDMICGTGVGGAFALYIWWVIRNNKKALIDKLIKCNFPSEVIKEKRIGA